MYICSLEEGDTQFSVCLARGVNLKLVWAVQSQKEDVPDTRIIQAMILGKAQKCEHDRKTDSAVGSAHVHLYL